MEHRIAYQGEEGCYSESAVFQLFGGSDVNGLPCDSFEVAFKSVVDGEATFALMPIENSLGGSIHANYDLLIKYGLHIVAELNFRVRHSIMALPGTKMKDVKTVMSHYQAPSSMRRIRSKTKAHTESDVRHSGKRQDDSRSKFERLCCDM